MRISDWSSDVCSSDLYPETLRQSGASINSYSRFAQGGVTLTVPLYRGGAVANGVKAAKARVESGQANVRATEASIFNAVVVAYMDVIRDSAIVALNQANVRALDVNLDATNERFEVGDLTRTRSEEHTSELQSLMRTSYAVFCF